MATADTPPSFWMMVAAGSMGTNVANNTTNARPFVAKYAPDGNSGFRYIRAMDMDEWVRGALAHSGMKQAELARRVEAKIGVPFDRSKINKLTIPGKRAVKTAELFAIADITGFPLPTEIDGVHLNPGVARLEPTVVSVEEAERVTGAPEAEPQGFHHGRYRPRVAGAIPEIDGAVGGGEGKDGEIVTFAIGPETYSAHRVVEEWVVPPSALGGQLGMSQTHAIVMRVTGDSMEPTYPAGQRVFIDTSHTQFTVDAVYVISDGENAPQIKRLQRVPLSSPPKVIIISDNPLLENFPVQLDALRIHGRVAGALVPR